MAITAGMVKELREMTGAGMMDCKKALTETNGDMEAAVEVLRKSGAAKMAKKASRIAAEGITRVAFNDNEVVVAEVNSETDFVAKNELFQNFVQLVADTALTSDLNGGKNGEDVEALLEMNGLKDELIEKTATIGEKLSVRRFAKVSGECVASYLHAGGKIGVILAADGAADAKEALTNVAMQIAAMNPSYLDEASVPAEVIEKEKDILIAQMKEDPKMANKPEQVLAKIVEGKIGKYYKENCLLCQEFVRSDLFEGAVNGYVNSVAKALGADIKVTSFVRFEKGEGIEKKEDNFAAEIASMM